MKTIPDSVLITELEDKVALERKTTSEILRYLIEVESRNVHLQMGYQSLFHFTVKHLHYSEGGAHRRISAARLLEGLGVDAESALQKIESGDLNLTQLNIAKQVLDFQKKSGDFESAPGDSSEILRGFEGMSTRECQIEAAKIMGVKLPEKEIKTVDGQGSARMTVTLDAETLALLDRFKAQTVHKNPFADTATALKLALQSAIEKNEVAQSVAQSFNGKIVQK